MRYRLLVVALLGLALASSARAQENAVPLCPRMTDETAMAATPIPAGTPTAISLCTPAGLGTPVAVGEETITVTASSEDAGPVGLTITLADAEGEPIDDASVTILSQHLEMNHGVSVRPAVMTARGVYKAEEVPMGMGGSWQVEIQIARPGTPVIAAVFTIDLKGPA
jgi:hypothetical protein